MEEEKKIHISYSEFSLYQGCGHRHLIEKYLKISEQPPSIHLYFGSAIHLALEEGLRDKINLEKRILVFKEYFMKEMIENMSDTYEFHDMNDFIEQGENILRYMSTEKVMEKYDVVGIEEPMYERLYGNFHFKGFLDLILKYKNKQKYKIVDWKSSSEAWNVDKKKKDKIFSSQTMFYKYFYSRKYNIPFEDIECSYVVLNRLKNKKDPSQGFGEMQVVDMTFTEGDMKEALNRMASTLRDIHIRNYFPKSKIVKKSKSDCFFCQYKDGNSLCNDNPEQYKNLLSEYKKR